MAQSPATVRRETPRICDSFLLGKPAEVTQFDESSLSCVQCSEPLQGVFQFQQIDRRRGCRYVVHADLPPTAAAFLAASPPRFIHEDSSNGSRRGGKEVDAVLPGERIATHQFDVGFVCQLRGVPVSRILIARPIAAGQSAATAGKRAGPIRGLPPRHRRRFVAGSW